MRFWVIVLTKNIKRKAVDLTLGCTMIPSTDYIQIQLRSTNLVLVLVRNVEGHDLKCHWQYIHVAEIYSVSHVVQISPDFNSPNTWLYPCQIGKIMEI